MPLTAKGKKLKEKFKEQYGKKKGESVFYAMENSGKLKKVIKRRGGGMDASKPDFKSSASPFSSGYKGAKATSTTINRGGNGSGPKTKNITTGSVTTGGGGSNITKAKNFVQNIGYQTKQLATKYLGLGKPKTKNLSDYRVTTREIGLMNKNKSGADRTLSTAKDIKEAFNLQGAYETRRGITKMLPSALKIGATMLSKPLEKGTIRNRKFFEKSVLGTDKKGSEFSDKSFTGLGVEARNEMYKDYAKRRMDKKIDAFGRPIRQGAGEGAQAKCPDGSFPPCVKTPTVTAVPKTSAAPKNFFDFQAYSKGGGVPYGPPPKKGPNSQVPPVKLSRGGGAAIRGTKFKGVF
ncbi:hypothetical protein N9C16_07690 [Paracoccaceae bacterium]|nr:hypothetical protein [Paracoccaceae bacterium]